MNPLEKHQMPHEMMPNGSPKPDAASYENPFPAVLEFTEARDILIEYIAGADARDLCRLYSVLAKKLVAILIEGKEVSCYRNGGPTLYGFLTEQRMELEQGEVSMAWKVADSPTKGFLEIRDEQGEIVAQLIKSVWNAKLMATAPEMLEILRTARVIVQSAGNMDLASRMWELILKAEGKK